MSSVHFVLGSQLPETSRTSIDAVRLSSLPSGTDPSPHWMETLSIGPVELVDGPLMVVHSTASVPSFTYAKRSKSTPGGDMRSTFSVSFLPALTRISFSVTRMLSH